MAGVPATLKQNGRPEDPNFEPAEKLFRRYKSEHYVGGEFSNIGLPFSTPPSTNRQKYSLPEDVLFSETGQFLSWGVLSFMVQDLPSHFSVEQMSYIFFPKHAPLENNYAHSEVWCDRLPRTGTHVVPSKQAKKLFRAYLSQRVSVVIEATV